MIEVASDDWWRQRWEASRIGWHETHGNELLKRYWRWRGRRVLVPLCGKSPDLHWLASMGNHVTGVELSELAVRSYFDEHRLEYSVCGAAENEYVAHALPIRLVVSDIFDFSETGFDALYDRAALIAIRPAQRLRYAQHIDQCLEPGSARMLIALEYDQALANGPPFAVMPAELSRLWPGLERLEARAEAQSDRPAKFAELDRFLEVAWASPSEQRRNQ